MRLMLIFSIACFCLVSFSNGNSLSGSRIPPVRAVSLGGWLVTEGWIKPSLFDAIPNKDFLDGTLLQFKSVKVGRYLSANNGGGIEVSNRTASDSGSFRLWRIDQSNFNFKVFNKKFVGVKGNRVVAEANTPSRSETFQILRNPQDQNRVRIKASNGYFLQVKTKRLVSADYKGNGGWGDDDPSVLLMNITGKMEGEYQVTNGYGPLLAPKVMKIRQEPESIRDGGAERAVCAGSVGRECDKASYEVVRKHSSTAYFVMGNRLGPHEPRELFGVAKKMTKAVIDVHFYNLFSDIFTNLTVQQNIDYIYRNRTEHIDYLTVPNGPLIFVGEWTAELLVNATKREYRRYGKAQLQVYGNTTFGWAFWTLRNVRNRWSWEWLIKHRYIKI